VYNNVGGRQGNRVGSRHAFLLPALIQNLLYLENGAQARFLITQEKADLKKWFCSMEEVLIIIFCRLKGTNRHVLCCLLLIVVAVAHPFSSVLFFGVSLTQPKGTRFLLIFNCCGTNAHSLYDSLFHREMMVPSRSEASEDDHGSNHGSSRTRTNNTSLPPGLRLERRTDLPIQWNSFRRVVVVERDNGYMIPSNYMNGRINNHSFNGDNTTTTLIEPQEPEDDNEDSLSDLPALEGEDEEEDTDAIGEEEQAGTVLIFYCS